MKNNIIGELLREERIFYKEKISQTELGKKLNMSQRKISRIENGDADPTPDDIVAFCKFYKCSSDYLLGLKKKVDEKEKITKYIPVNYEFIGYKSTDLTDKITKEKEVIDINIYPIEELVHQYNITEDTIIKILEDKLDEIPQFYGTIQLLKEFELLEDFIKEIRLSI